MKIKQLLFLFALIISVNTMAQDRPPNIVLLMADDMGYECLSANGSTSYNTPVLDNLGEKGIRFNYAISQPLCTPSRVKIMTGKSNYKNYKSFGYLDTNEKTFGNLLQDEGYATCIVGKWQLNGMDSKFETSKEDMLKRPQYFGFEEYCLWNFIGGSRNRYADPNLYQNGKQLTGLEDAYGPDVVSDYAIDFMKRNKEKPFLLYYPMILTHNPFLPTPDSKEWKDKSLRRKGGQRFFKDMVEYTDKIVLKLVDAIEELGLDENTIFIFTADNGTYGAITTQTINGAFQGGKGTMPDAGTHVPMVVYNPSKIKKGFDYNELFEFNDFLPTMAEAAGIPIPEYADGKSIYPLLSNKKQTTRETVFIHYDPLKRGKDNAWYGRFVRNKTYKLYNDNRFYNVRKDSEEKHPIPDAKLTQNELVLKEKFLAELNAAPPHHFKQSDEYPVKKAK
jgi:arylsulfatase A